MKPEALIPLCAAFLAGAFLAGAGLAAGGNGGPARPAIPLPAPGAQWDWQLSAPVTPPAGIAAFDTDPESITSAQMAALKNAGVYTICYVSVGTVENYRADAARFPASVVGKVHGDWPDEKFLDIRRIDVLLPIMRERFARCRAMGFDAIEADNIDAYANDSGFAISAADTVACAEALADAAHGPGPDIARKNVPELAGRLIGKLDFAIIGSCHQDGRCAQIRPCPRAGKPVFDAEYGDRATGFAAACAPARQYGIPMIPKDRDLHAGGKRRTS